MTNAPRLSFTAPRVEDAVADELFAGDDYEGMRFSVADFGEFDLTGTTFRECELASVTLSEAGMRGTRFIESLITASFAPVLRAPRSTWRDSLVESPRWGSAELFDSELRMLHIRGGKIDYLNLRGSTLSDVLIEDCVITDLDLGGATTTRVALKNCRIDTIDLTRATNVDLDLRGSDFAALNGLDGARGVVIDEGQLSLLAPLLAGQLGIVVE
ncbi:pentapeptide repeat-containing protein [Lacisediminihabitans changchengi]|uniref:Pentapeptide repeat-containing protein n=1 Tax=Lacisediminihabitans changchengi TaxID=2787634 RepID=A0A934SND4_9MICO|nr:pentapeptide repeat-containing protein [Lacisediminihabitans changchengi]MBK4346040.1 pentapeptide repeat-containing protein [Lacisediminihabitans changchengi]